MIAACHRLKKSKYSKCSNIIVRFIDRKKAFACLKNRSKLKESPYKEAFKNSIFINENLCPAYKEILNKCKALRKQGSIVDCWSFNGIIDVKKDINSKNIKLFHLQELEEELNINEL